MSPREPRARFRQSGHVTPSERRVGAETRGGGKNGTKPTRLDFQSGCMDPRYGKLRVAIASVPKILDVERMLNPRAVTP